MPLAVPRLRLRFVQHVRDPGTHDLNADGVKSCLPPARMDLKRNQKQLVLDRLDTAAADQGVNCWCGGMGLVRSVRNSTSCAYSPSAPSKSVQWQVKPAKLQESRVCVFVLLWVALPGTDENEFHDCSVFHGNGVSLVPGKPALTGLWLPGGISAGDLSACPIVAGARPGWDWAAQRWGLGSG